MEERVLTEHLDLMTVSVPCSTLDHTVIVCKRINSSSLISNLSHNSPVILFITDYGNVVSPTIDGLTSEVCLNTLLTEISSGTDRNGQVTGNKNIFKDYHFNEIFSAIP